MWFVPITHLPNPLCQYWTSFSGSREGWDLPYQKHKRGKVQNYQNEVLAPVANPYLHTLGQNSVHLYDNALPHRVVFVRAYLQNLYFVKMECPACNPNLNVNCGMSLGALFVLEWSTQPHGLKKPQTLVKEWVAVTKQYVTKLVTSISRRCQSVVVRHCWGLCFLNDFFIYFDYVLFLRTSIIQLNKSHKNRVNSRKNNLALPEKIWQVFHGLLPAFYI